MFDGIPAGFVTGSGLSGLVALAVLLIMGGKLIPKSTHDQAIADRDKQIEFLKSALLTEVERGRVRDGQVSELLEHARTTNAFIRAMPRATPEAAQ